MQRILRPADTIRAVGVCAVVVTYNRRDLLVECLEHLERQSRRPDRILVVDAWGFSRPKTKDALQALSALGGRRPDLTCVFMICA